METMPTDKRSRYRCGFMLFCAVLYCFMLFYTVLYCFYAVLYCFVLFLCCSILFCTVFMLFCTVSMLFFTALYCFYAVLYCFCTVFVLKMMDLIGSRCRCENYEFVITKEKLCFKITQKRGIVFKQRGNLYLK